jgi:hypothetical protein
MTNDKFRIHLISDNGMRGNQQGADGPEGRAQLLKYAIFYLAVAAILFATNQPAKNPMGGRDPSQSPSNLRIDLSVARKLAPNRSSSNAAGGGTYVVRFRLTNQGNQPIFYPASLGTNCPMGHVVYRIAPGSDWGPLLTPELYRSGLDEPNANGNIAWVEMRPGGWADGEYEDPGSPTGEHAYELDLKFAEDGKVSPLLSHPYLTSVN